MSNELELLNSKLQTLNNENHSPALSTDNSGIYQIVGGDELIGKIDSVISHLESAELTEDDRDMVRATRKFTNDFIKAVDRSVIDERARVFDPVNEQRRNINERMTVMKNLLAQRLDEFDNRIRTEKRHELLSHFNDEQIMGEYATVLTDVSFEMIENQSWTNRSASLPKAKQELSERVRSIASVVSLADEEDKQDALGLLVKNDWNLPDVIIDLETRKKNREEKKNEELRIAKLIQEAEQRGREEAQRQSAVQSHTTDEPTVDSEEAETVEREETEVDLHIRIRGGAHNEELVRGIVNQALSNAVTEGVIPPDCYTMDELNG